MNIKSLSNRSSLPLSLLRSAQNMVERTRFRMKRVKTYALIGESGTGKSFQAHSVASLLNCRYIVDDGLLICDQRIVAGKTAKNETSPLQAVRRAIFSDDEHARQVREAIRRERADRIMILGTSEKMVHRICSRLDLPFPEKTVRIDEIAPPEQLEVARKSRTLEGKHVIPAPQVEVKKVFSHTIVASISHLISSYRMYRHPPRTLEKSIVQPGYHLGRTSISETALQSLVRIVMERHHTDLEVRQVRVNQDEGSMHVQADLAVGLHDNLPVFLHQLQQTVFGQVRQITGMHVGRVDLNVVDIVVRSDSLSPENDGRSSKKKKKRKFKGGRSKESPERGEE